MQKVGRRITHRGAGEDRAGAFSRRVVFSDEMLYVRPILFVNPFSSTKGNAMPSFLPVKQIRVSDVVFKQLKSAILSGQFSPGQKLPSERELTETFQISRVVVREAIRSLETAGFVTIRQGPHGGAYVKELGFDRVFESFLDLFLVGRMSVAELIQVRQLIQPEVSRLAALHVNAASARLLEEALAFEAAPKPSHAERVKGRMATDLVLAEMCGNRLYQAILEPILRLTQEIILTVKPEKTVFHDHSEHQAIVDAVLAQNGPEAAAATSKHLNTVRSGLLKLEKDFRKRTGTVSAP